MQTVSRLIQQFVPEHYQLTLTINRRDRVFDGVITMNGTTLAGATSIPAHAKDLSIASATVDGKEATVRQGENDEITISHPDIKEGRHIVVLAFSGTITDAMHGMYPCYFEHDGSKKELIATQFESHHAREVFPCIDEPEAKATFDVTLITEQDVTVLGNMPVHAQKIEDDQLVTTFDTTPKMSTYLLAWVYGEMHRKTAVTKSGVEVNIWATPAQKPESLDFALDIATRTIDFLNDYFDTPYPLPKSDHVALPDFSSGAMENWGLITYREVALLADPATTSISSKHYIATVVAHELSHQWFGNLVTMKWWNNLWLNESFATVMEYLVVDALQPDWNVWLDFATQESIASLRRDSLEGVQPVQTDVHHPDEIGTLFDGAIVYAKGARLLRMIQHYIGSEAFQAGLKEYFATHAYGNTEGNDLWNALASASGKDIANIMNTWISQSGFPVVSVKENGGQLTLSQKQFFVGPHEPSEKLWPIPLNSSSPAVPELLRATSVAIEKPAEPIRLNVGDTAHFITHYDAPLLQKLLTQVTDGTLSPLDRLQLLHEQTLLARGGVIATRELIPLLDAYQNETTEPVWDIISLAVGELKKFVEDDERSEKRLRALSGKLARAQYERLGWEPKTGEDEADTKLRATVIAMMLYSEDETVIQTALDLYRSHTLEELDPELRPLIIGATVRHGDNPKVIDTLIETYASTNSADLKEDISSGLTSTKNKEVITRLLGMLKDSSIIRQQDVVRWVVWTIRNRNGRELTWQWIRDNWAWIDETFGGDKSYDYFPRIAGNVLMTKEHLQEYREFFTPLQSDPSLTRAITIGLREIEGRAELVEREATGVREALAKL